ncbi:MAG: YicC family protein, partial [Planctomycetota bacterium]|nr:YicC family protein [Planctomycetota bacterium]
MTGFGEAARQNDHMAATVEVRTVNNRYLKVSA